VMLIFMMVSDSSKVRDIQHSARFSPREFLLLISLDMFQRPPQRRRFFANVLRSVIAGIRVGERRRALRVPIHGREFKARTKKTAEKTVGS
jgi:hypothetical protein